MLLVRKTSLGPNFCVIIYICPGGGGGSGGAGTGAIGPGTGGATGGGTGGAGGVGGSVNFTFSPVVPNSAVSGMAPSAPQPEPQLYGMMGLNSEPPVYPDSRMYSDVLLCRGRGFPLYRPEPRPNLPEEYRRTGIAIGDVGVVTVEGGFEFFFNIYLPANNPINIDAPEDFVPLSACPSRRDIDNYDFHPGDHVSTGIHKLSGFTNSTVGGEFVFECAGPKGAVLALPHGAHLEKLRKLAFMRQYAAKNARSWYKYLNETKGCELQNSSLLLITGCEKAKSWGIALFHHLSLQHKFQLSFKPEEDAESGYRYRWEGPYCSHKQVDVPPAETPLNQTTFIHAFTISLPETIWETLFGDVTIRHLVDSLAPTDKAGGRFVPHGSQWSLLGSVTDLVLGHPGIYSNLLELQHAIMYFTTLRRHLTRANAGLSS
ncbi:hypothetical protein B0H14DRAFT_1325149 [Mycena olivaceomarginata]|nr:hypothetical protein B0H14DRAFT_1325149 [Mycena olivaceomarginata]